MGVIVVVAIIVVLVMLKRLVSVLHFSLRFFSGEKAEKRSDERRQSKADQRQSEADAQSEAERHQGEAERCEFISALSRIAPLPATYDSPAADRSISSASPSAPVSAVCNSCPGACSWSLCTSMSSRM